MSISRRCLICSNYNPCVTHSEQEQERELNRNSAKVKETLKMQKRMEDGSRADISIQRDESYS